MKEVTFQKTPGRLQQRKLPKRGRMSPLPMQAAAATIPFAALAPKSQDTTASALESTPGVSAHLVPQVELWESVAEFEMASPAFLDQGKCPPTMMMGSPCP